MEFAWMSRAMKMLAGPVCAALITLAGPAWADVSRDDAAAAAQRAAGGRVLSVEKSGAAWRVKVITSHGEVRVILIDAATGKPM